MRWIKRLLASDRDPPSQPPAPPLGPRINPVGAIERGDLDGVKAAVAADPGVILADCPWATPNGTLLHVAADAGHPDIAEFLIAAGARVNARWRKSGETPLFFAVTNGHLAVVELLLKRRAQVNLRDTVVRETPLLAAIFHGRDAIARLLVLRGADVRVRNHFGTEAPEMARLHKQPELADYLQHRKDRGYIRRSLAPAQVVMITTLQQVSDGAVSRVDIHFEGGESLYGLNLTGDDPPSVLLPIEYEHVAIRTIEVPKDQL